MTYITKEQAPLTSELVNEKLGRMVNMPPHHGCYDYAQRIIEHAALMEGGWERAEADVDKLLRRFGIEPETCRSEGGLLLVGKAEEFIKRACLREGNVR